MEPIGHIPVLPAEVVELLAPAPGDVIVDGTTGRGGHSLALAEASGDLSSVQVIGFDLDAENLAFAQKRLGDAGVRFTGIHDSFVRMPQRLRKLEIQATVVLADLGFSSNQMDTADRGFAFKHDGPLDMRFDQQSPVTAADLLATLDEQSLADLIFRYGEDPFARAIARKLVGARSVEPIQTTSRLANIVEDAYGARARASRMHPATRTFMALRIAVNDELTALDALLDQITRGAEGAAMDSWLGPGARVGIISFHSLEDRLTKHGFADLVQRDLATSLTRSVVRPSDMESEANPRARSAKLRAIQLRD